MSNKRYPEEFKIEVVKQSTEKGYKIYDLASRLGTSTHSTYIWLKNSVQMILFLKFRQTSNQK